MLLRGMNVSCLRLWKVSLLSPCWQAHEVNYYSVVVHRRCYYSTSTTLPHACPVRWYHIVAEQR